MSAVDTALTKLVERLPLPKQRGRIVTAPDMSVPGQPGVWALRESLHRSLSGEPTQPFSYRSRGQFSMIGHQQGVAEVFGLRLSGVMPWILRRGVYLANFPTLSRKDRVLFRVDLDLPVPPDIAHLSLSRTSLIRLAGPQHSEVSARHQ